ncbi:hypothetical protein A3860_38025 [Niastella vici]|uniref:Uncharacterized protein n=1 Tax=Niastella vici TaxID=1703345 RepID=A0A1V9FLM7_9BACT|nr:hypothetical protein [Niastella vici]OQP59255.1 hypothetical protein A3860_38025 [Niastella vici]
MKTCNNHPQWYNEPLRLTEEQTNEPTLALDDFFQCYHLNEVRQTLWQWVVAVISSAGSVSDDHHERNNHLYFYEKMEMLVEANWIMRRGCGKNNTPVSRAPGKQGRVPADEIEVPHTRFSKPARLIEKISTEPKLVIQEVFSEVTWEELHEYLLPTWLRVAVVSSESPYSDGDGRQVLYEFYDQLMIFIEALYISSEAEPEYSPSFLSAEQSANPSQVITAFFQQCPVEYVHRELCDFLDAGLGYDGGSFPNGFTPWQAWMAYNHVLCLVEAGYQLYVNKEGMIALAASQIKGKILFPKKMEEAKKILERARIVKE